MHLRCFDITIVLCFLHAIYFGTTMLLLYICLPPTWLGGRMDRIDPTDRMQGTNLAHRQGFSKFPTETYAETRLGPKSGRWEIGFWHISSNKYLSKMTRYASQILNEGAAFL